MYNALEPFFKEFNIPAKHQKNILLFLDQYNRESNTKSFKDYATVLIKHGISSKTKKEEILQYSINFLSTLIQLVYPEWDINQLIFEIEINDSSKVVKIIEKNELTERLFNTIINF
jgi:hypothetical protein